MRKSLESSKTPHCGAKPKQGTFIVKVEFTQNETWQGQVTWADENKTERFRSMLELIKLMDGAMTASHDEDVKKESTA